MSTLLSVTLPPPPFRAAEALRYAGARRDDSATEARLLDAYREAAPHLSYTAVYRIFDITADGDTVTVGPIQVTSRTLSGALSGCRRAMLLAATVGARFDRLLLREGRLSPARALLFEAIGAERAEALLDALEGHITEALGASLSRRVSPGYGDLPLALQKEIFPLLDCERRLGLTLSESLLMSPKKSVTAFIGIED